MNNWLKALWSETLFSVWWILSALSTLATFFFSSLSGKPRLALAVSAIVGFAWANFRAFRKQQREILRLKDELSLNQSRIARLRITPTGRSHYILAPVNNIPHSDFRGGYFEFGLMIENTGPRDSTVNDYQIEIVELQQTYRNLVPIEGKNGVQGRHCIQGLDPPRILSVTGNVRISAENATNQGTLLFFIPDLNRAQFTGAGLLMHGPEMKFDSLHCRLTLTDTMGTQATADFDLHES